MIALLNVDKTLNDDGRKLVEWLDAQCDYADSLPADESVHFLNTLSGPIRQYYVDVRKLHSHTSAGWVEHFGKSWAQDAWRIMAYVEAEQVKAQQAQQTADKTSALEDQLKALESKLMGKIDALEAENAALKAGKGKKPAKTEDATEAALEGDESEA